jgi:hypothetical protein
MGGFHPVGEIHRDVDVDAQAELAAGQGRAVQGASSGIPPFSLA